MRFLVDAQLPPAPCGWFGERGFEAETAGLAALRQHHQLGMRAWLLDRWMPVLARLEAGERLIEVR